MARAFTCYQAEVLLAGVVECTSGSIHTQSIRPDQHRPAPITCTPTSQLDQPRPVPILATGLLTPFADENVPRGERLRLLGRCIQHLKRLAGSAPVLVSAVPPAADVSAASIEAATAEAAEFLARLETAADQVWRFEAENAQAALLRQRRASSVPAGQLRMFYTRCADRTAALILTLKGLTLWVEPYLPLPRPSCKSRSLLPASAAPCAAATSSPWTSLFASAHQHLAASAYASHALPFETLLLAMLLEEHKEVIRLRERLEYLEATDGIFRRSG